MRTLVVYDSEYGNTEQIARAIGNALGSPPDVVTLHVSEVAPNHLAGINRLVVGSPTQRFSPTPAISDFLKGIPKNGLKNIEVAAFDTRFNQEKIDAVSSVLSLSVKVAGKAAYAAKKIADGLKKKGGELLAEPEGFFVRDTEGPLLEGELERAAEWARQVFQKSGES
jgi:flavodoxin